MITSKHKFEYESVGVVVVVVVGGGGGRGGGVALIFFVSKITKDST